MATACPSGSAWNAGLTHIQPGGLFGGGNQTGNNVLPAKQTSPTVTAFIATLLLSLSSLAAAADKAIIPWSFKPLKRPAVPQVSQADWPRDDIDRFILAKLDAAKLTPSKDAPRWMLIRRATLDLHGLLPTPQEVIAFEKDPRPTDAAFAEIVDRLLKSPRFGERWARHWLDLVRYADSTGRAWNAPFIYAFRYRDWVIDALNADMPYTRFMAAQVAGDLLPARDDTERANNLIATGFLTLGSLDLTEGQQEMFVMNRVDDQIDVTTRAFLGLTIACARCHDHKYDPIKQTDYYALAGMFYSTTTLAGTANKTDMGRNLYVDPDRLVTLPVKGSPSPAATPKAQSGEVNLFDDDSKAAPAMSGGMSGIGMDERDNKGYLIGYATDPTLTMGVSEGDIQNCSLRVAGDPYQEGPTPKRGEWEIPSLPSIPAVPRNESGRAQLAQWLGITTHPLTSRVMANRVWARLFGRGIVTTVDDFGITGEKPDHPELMDHLAIRFVEVGWSVKKLIRAVMLSRAYRQSSESNADGREIDPDNVMVWRMTPRRIEAEVLRDTLLQTSGMLRDEKPQGIQVAGSGGKGNTARTRSLLSLESPYRTIYLPVLRDLLPQMHETWDFPNPSQIKGQREVTTVPSQSLFLLNDEFVMRRAEEIAESGTSDANSTAAAQRLHRMLLSREATKDELADAKEFLGSDPDGDTLAAYVQAIIGGAEYRYAW